MSYIVFDLIILAVLIWFALRGLRRGLILSLFSLLSVLVALVGAVLLSNLWAPALSQRLQPALQPTVASAIEAALPDIDVDSSKHHLLSLLEDAQLPFGLEKYLPDLQTEEETGDTATPTWRDELSASMSEKLASTIAQNGLFVLCFLLILVLWKLLARTLDLVTRLPGLHALNKLGGFALGALRGALVLLICAWLVRWLGSDLIPAETVEQSRLLRFFMTFDLLEHLKMK